MRKLEAPADGGYRPPAVTSARGGGEVEAGRGAGRRREISKLANQPTRTVTTLPTTPYQRKEVLL